MNAEDVSARPGTRAEKVKELSERNGVGVESDAHEFPGWKQAPLAGVELHVHRVGEDDGVRLTPHNLAQVVFGCVAGVYAHAGASVSNRIDEGWPCAVVAPQNIAHAHQNGSWAHQGGQQTARILRRYGSFLSIYQLHC